MPVRSRKAFKKMWAMAGKGEMSEDMAHEMTHGSDYKSLPERVPASKKKRWVKKHGKK